MNPLAFAATVLLVAIAAVAIAFWYSRSQPAKPQTDFEAFAIDPEYRAAVTEQWFAARQEREALENWQPPANLSDAEVRQMVEMLFAPDQYFTGLAKLKKVRGRARPYLIQALADSRLDALTFEPTGGGSTVSPVAAILILLGRDCPPEAVETAARLVNSSEEYVRWKLADGLGSVGSQACVEPMRALLRDEDGYVRNAVVWAVMEASKRGDADPEFLVAMFDGIVPLLDQRDETVSGNVPICLVKLDREKAVPVLLSRLEPACPQLQYILLTFLVERIAVPSDKLQTLLDRLEPLSAQYPYFYAYGEGLKLAAQQREQSAESRIRRVLNQAPPAESEETGGLERLQELAVEALGILHGVDEPARYVFKLWDEVGFEKLASPQQQLIAVRMLIDEVNNGGFVQYFTNSSGDHAVVALHGLKAIGAQRTAEILERAMNVFGSAGPQSDGDARERQMSRLSRSALDTLSACDSTFYENKDRDRGEVAGVRHRPSRALRQRSFHEPGGALNRCCPSLLLARYCRLTPAMPAGRSRRRGGGRRGRRRWTPSRTGRS